MNEALTVGDECKSHDVKIYGGDENDDTYIYWDSSANILSVKGDLIVGTSEDTDPADGVSDSHHNVIFHGANGSSLEWESSDDRLKLNSHLVVEESTQLNDVTIGTDTVGANLTIHGSDTSGNSITWDKTNDNLRIKGHLHVGEIGTGYTVQLNSSSALKYINWNPDTCKLQINGNICGGEECSGVSFKVWGNDSGKYINWDNSVNKLSIIGNVDIGSDSHKQTVTLFGSVNAEEKPLVWDGNNGTLTNNGKTILKGITEIQNQLTVGEIDGNHQLLVYGDAAGKNLTWVDHKLSVNGLLDVSEKTTLNGDLETNQVVTFKSDAVGKALTWYNNDNTLEVTGITNLFGALTVTSVDSSIVTINSNICLEKPVQVNDTLSVGADETEYQVKFYGSTSGKYMEWNNNELKVTGSANICGEFITNNNVELASSDPAKNITWTHNTHTLDISGLSNFHDSCVFKNDITVENTGSLLLEGSDPANINIKWEPDKLTIQSDVDIHNNILQLIDNDVIIKSCSNDYSIEWNNTTSELELDIVKATLTGELEINYNGTNKFIKWDGSITEINADVIVTNHNLTIQGNDATFCLENNDPHDRNIKWTATGDCLLDCTSDVRFNYNDGVSNLYSNFAADKLEVNVCAEFSKNITILGNAGNIEWDTTFLISNAPIQTNNHVIIKSDVNKFLNWDKEFGVLVADSLIEFAGDGCNIEWDNINKLSINANLDIKKGNIGIYDSVDINNPVERIHWESSQNVLTITGSEVILQADDPAIKIHWNPSDKLWVCAPVQLDGTLVTNNTVTTNDTITTNNDIIIKGTGLCDTKDITWISETGILTMNGSELNVLNDVMLGGCDNDHKVEWNSDENTLDVFAESTFTGNVNLKNTDNSNNIEWDAIAGTITSTNTTVTLNGDQTHSTVWDKSSNRLTVNGSIVKTPFESQECGDVTLDLNNNNNFHLTLTGNIELKNPINACTGQEGRIVIMTDAPTTITYDSSWIFQNCVDGVLSTSNTSTTIDVLVYYVLSPSKILVRIENNYGCPPPANC